ncbi:zinc-binding alcohol dehydrogenase family protein [Pediococcus argentinicus]|uniref:zinc-binding alcohol dehydrogenase family protein n=1 Tax=Pediococcus argentinicus TaxID=480391 RepID=UPI00338E409E
MKAIFSVADNQFKQSNITTPSVSGYDVLVQVQSVSVNPVDVKVASTLDSDNQKILGYDGVGVIKEMGEQVSGFELNERVFFSGSNIRSGSNAEMEVIDSRIIAHAPLELSDADAASMPLTSITAWESLFEKMALIPKADANHQTILIINGAGGVGSVAIQLAKWAGLKVIATASRPETIDWVKKMGADKVINHRQDLKEQLGDEKIDLALILHSTDMYLPQLASIVAPEGIIVSIVENEHPIEIGLLKDKSISFAWEFMFTKTKYQVDVQSQGMILAEVSKLLDQKLIKSTTTKIIDGFSVDSFEKAYQLVRSNRMIGKAVIKY